jgi:hypothetical protein
MQTTRRHIPEDANIHLWTSCFCTQICSSFYPAMLHWQGNVKDRETDFQHSTYQLFFTSLNKCHRTLEMVNDTLSLWDECLLNNSVKRMESSGMLRHVALVRTNVLEELSVSFIGVTRIGELGTLAVTSNWRTLRALFLVHRFVSPWWRRR